MAFDSSGNLYVADGFADTITRITPAGTPTTIVSSGLNQPQGLAFDSSGNLYEADYGSHGNGIIQEFTSTGAPVKVISLLPFTFVTPEGLAFDSAGNLYVPDNRTPGNVYEITPAGVVSIFASGLDDPEYLAFSPALTQDTSFQVSYAANLNIGDSYIDIANDGLNGASASGPGFGPATGDICVNVYAVDPGEELISCCSCLITPDATANLGVVRDLTSNTVTGATVTSVTVKLLATLPVAGLTPGTVTCNNSAAGLGGGIVNGMAAFGTTLHETPAGSYATTERPFTSATLSTDELASLQGRCASIVGNASGFGVCASCRAGALGAAKLPQ